MHVDIPHKFSKAEALERVKVALEEVRAKAGKDATIHEERWEDNVLHFDVEAQGQRISGTFAIEENRFDLHAKLPLMLRMFEGRIEKAIKEQAEQMLG